MVSVLVPLRQKLRFRFRNTVLPLPLNYCTATNLCAWLMAALLARLSASWMARVTSGLSSLVPAAHQTPFQIQRKIHPGQWKKCPVNVSARVASVFSIYGSRSCISQVYIHPDPEAQNAEFFREKKLVKSSQIFWFSEHCRWWISDPCNPGFSVLVWSIKVELN